MRYFIKGNGIHFIHSVNVLLLPKYETVTC
jgi:hypothetical protein